DLRLDAFALAPHAAEQIDLPGSIQVGLIRGIGRVQASRDGSGPDRARAVAARSGRVAELRKELRPGRGERAQEPVDAGSGGPGVEIPQKGLVDALIQRGGL